MQIYVQLNILLSIRIIRFVLRHFLRLLTRQWACRNKNIFSKCTITNDNWLVVLMWKKW